MAASAVRIRLRDRRNPLLRALFKSLELLYKTPLRVFLGRYYLVLKHRGRRSGRIYSTVLDIAHVDKATGEVFVSSGWGDRSDWWRNLKASDAVEIRIGRKTFVPEQRFLDDDEGYRIRKLACKNHPFMTRRSLLLLNYPKPVIDKDIKRWARDMPFVAFRPAD